MNIEFDQALTDYMKAHKKENILVEVISSNASDFEVTELHLRFVPDKFADRLCTTKNYRRIEAPVGGLIMPPYRLEISDTISLTLKSFLFIKWIGHTGIKL